jgi:hypothetical protein
MKGNAMVRTAALLFALAGIAGSAAAQSAKELGGFRPEEFGALGAQPTIVVLNPGIGELRTLRYHLAAGTTYKVAMTAQGSASAEMNGQELPSQKAPGFKFTQLVTVLRSTETESQLEAPVKGEVAVEAVRLHYTVTNRGVVKDSRFDAKGEISPALRERLQESTELSFSLPEDPVGVGGKWRALRQMRHGGLTMYQVLTVVVAKFEKTVVDLDVELEQFVPEQRYAAPGQPANVPAEAHGHSKGKGSTQLDLSAPGSRGSMSIDGDLTMSVQADPQKPTEVKTHMQLRMRSELEKMP